MRNLGIRKKVGGESKDSRESRQSSSKCRNMEDEMDIEKIKESLTISEYEALRAEKLNRYDYSNKLFAQLLAFTSAIVGANLAMYAVYGELLKDGSHFSTDSVFIISLEFTQCLVFLLPAIFSTILFKFSLENSIRINLLSEYMRHRWPKGMVSWEQLKKDRSLSYFSNNDTKENPHKVGDMLVICIGVTGISLIASYMMFISVIINCFSETREYHVQYFVVTIVSVLLCCLLYKFLKRHRKTRTIGRVIKGCLYLLSPAAVIVYLFMPERIDDWKPYVILAVFYFLETLGTTFICDYIYEAYRTEVQIFDNSREVALYFDEAFEERKIYRINCCDDIEIKSCRDHSIYSLLDNWEFCPKKKCLVLRRNFKIIINSNDRIDAFPTCRNVYYQYLAGKKNVQNVGEPIKVVIDIVNGKCIDLIMCPIVECPLNETEKCK